MWTLEVRGETVSALAFIPPLVVSNMVPIVIKICYSSLITFNSILDNIHLPCMNQPVSFQCSTESDMLKFSVEIHDSEMGNLEV